MLLGTMTAGLAPMAVAPASAASTMEPLVADSTLFAAPRALGQIEQVSPTRVRVSGCQGVSAPLEANLRIANADPSVARRGVITVFSGGGGTGWWGASTTAQQAIADLSNAGFRVVEVAWADGWLKSASGERPGPHALACRPATVIRWMYDTMYAPLGLNPPAGVCGFCVSGNSGGASQVSYALTFYGLETILDAVVPTGGPPHAALDKGCLRRSGEAAYYYTAGNASTIDSSYGYASGTGPCANRNSSFTDRWIADSVEAGDTYHPSTRVHFIGNGRAIGETHGKDYYDAITSPMKINEVDPNLPHGVHNSEAGAAAIVRALTRRR